MTHGESNAPDYADDLVLLSVEGPTASNPLVRVRAAGSGVGVVLDLSATGASRLATMLTTATVNAAARGLENETDE